MTDTLTRLQEDVLSAVTERRRHNPITGKEIASVVGLKPRSTGKEGADLRSIVNALRSKGYAVCASGRGYYWPATQEELDVYFDRFEARLIDMSKAIAGMRFGRGSLQPTMLKKEVAQQKMYYYEVAIEGEIKCLKVAGSRISEFLAKFPEAKKV